MPTSLATPARLVMAWSWSVEPRGPSTNPTSDPRRGPLPSSVLSPPVETQVIMGGRGSATLGNEMGPTDPSSMSAPPHVSPWLADPPRRLPSGDARCNVPPGSGRAGPWWIPLGLVALCLLPRAVAAWQWNVLWADAVSYLRAAELLAAGAKDQAFDELGFNLYPVLLSWLQRLPGNQHAWAEGWSVVAASLAVLPLWGWMRRQFDERIALLGGVLYAFQAKLVVTSPLVIRDPTFWLLITTSLYLLWRAASEQRFRWYLLAAGAVAAACLTRTEGWLLMVPAVGWTLFVPRARFPRVGLSNAPAEQTAPVPAPGQRIPVQQPPAQRENDVSPGTNPSHTTNSSHKTHADLEADIPRAAGVSRPAPPRRPVVALLGTLLVLVSPLILIGTLNATWLREAPRWDVLPQRHLDILFDWLRSTTNESDAGGKTAGLHGALAAGEANRARDPHHPGMEPAPCANGVTLVSRRSGDPVADDPHEGETPLSVRLVVRLTKAYTYVYGLLALLGIAFWWRDYLRGEHQVLLLMALLLVAAVAVRFARESLDLRYFAPMVIASLPWMALGILGLFGLVLRIAPGAFGRTNSRRATLLGGLVLLAVGSQPFDMHLAAAPFMRGQAELGRRLRELQGPGHTYVADLAETRLVEHYAAARRLDSPSAPSRGLAEMSALIHATRPDFVVLWARTTADFQADRRLAGALASDGSPYRLLTLGGSDYLERHATVLVRGDLPSRRAGVQGPGR